MNKKMLFPLCAVFLFFCVGKSLATHQQATNASNLVTGTLPNERLDASSVTLRGNLLGGDQTLRVSSLTVTGNFTAFQSVNLGTTGVIPGTYTGANVTVDASGRITGIQTGVPGNQYDYVISQDSTSAVFSGFNQVPFIQVATTAENQNKNSSVLILSGTAPYTFSQHVSFSSNTSVYGYNYPTIQNVGNISVLSVSGSISGIQLNPVNAWSSPYFLHLNSSATASNLRFLGSLGTASTRKNGLVRLSGVGAILKDSRNGEIPAFSNFTNNPIIAVADCFSCKTLNNNFQNILGEINITNSSETVIDSNFFKTISPVAVFNDEKSLGSIIITNNVFTTTTSVGTHGVIHDEAPKTLGNVVVGNYFKNLEANGGSAYYETDGSSGTLVSSNYFYGWANATVTGTSTSNLFLHGNFGKQNTAMLNDSGINTIRRDNFNNGAMLTDD